MRLPGCIIIECANKSTVSDSLIFSCSLVSMAGERALGNERVRGVSDSLSVSHYLGLSGRRGIVGEGREQGSED